MCIPPTHRTQDSRDFEARGSNLMTPGAQACLSTRGSSIAGGFLENPMNLVFWMENPMKLIEAGWFYGYLYFRKPPELCFGSESQPPTTPPNQECHLSVGVTFYGLGGIPMKQAMSMDWAGTYLDIDRAMDSMDQYLWNTYQNMQISFLGDEHP